MQKPIPLQNILFLDVETVPVSPDFEQLPDVFKPLWEKKSLRLKKSEEQTPEMMFNESAGIYAEFGKIVCISTGFFYKKPEEEKLLFRVKSFYSHDEKELLQSFAQLLKNHFNSPSHYLCGHNGKEFDFPYISRRMIVNSIPLPLLLCNHGKKPWETTLLDTMELWKFGDYKNFTSLALLAALFDIPTPKDDIDGSDVSRVYYQDNDLERIAVYCAKDVVTTARVYLRYMDLGVLDDEGVMFI